MENENELSKNRRQEIYSNAMKEAFYRILMQIPTPILKKFVADEFQKEI